MIEGETPEEYQRRLKREQNERFRERKRAEAAGEPLPPTRKPGRRPYEPGPGEESREDRRKRQLTEASHRFRAKPEYPEIAEAYRATEEHKESVRRYQAKPGVREKRTADMRRYREEGSIPMNYPKESGSPQSPYTLEREPFRPQGTQSELDRAARNREMVARNEAAKPYKEKGGRPKKGENAHMWWRKLW